MGAKAYINNISFPSNLEELSNRIDEFGTMDMEDVIASNPGEWSVPKYAKAGELVFFMHTKTANAKISAVKREYLNSQDKDKNIWNVLLRAKEIYKKFGGKIFAIGFISEDPECYDPPLDYEVHFKSKYFANITNTFVLDNPIDISEFRDFIKISQFGSITILDNKKFNKLRELILTKNKVPDCFKTYDFI